MKEYILIEWPVVQELMDELWFEEEALLHHNLAFVPKKRVWTLREEVNSYENFLSKVYGNYISEFLRKIKEYDGNSIELWKEELLGNITMNEFINLIKTDELFNSVWGKLD